MSYILEHTVFYDSSFSWVHLLTIVLLLGVVFYCHRKVHKMKTEQKDAEDALAAKYAADTMAQAEAVAAEKSEN